MLRRAGTFALLALLATAGISDAATERPASPSASQTAAAQAARTRTQRAPRAPRAPRTTPARPVARAQQQIPAQLPAIRSKAGLWQLTPRKDNAGWVSPAGVEYEAYGYGHDTRPDVILEHLDDKPEMGIYGVFDGKEHPLALIDEAFAKFRANPTGGTGIKVDSDAKRTMVTVDLGRDVGYVGGKAGRQQRKPASSLLQLILDPNAGHRLITAYPVAPRSTSRPARGGFSEPQGYDPRFGGPKKITNVPKYSKRATDGHVQAGAYAVRKRVASEREVESLLRTRGGTLAQLARAAAQHVLLGLPTEAGTADDNDYLSADEEFVVSWNRARNTPNWVSWRVEPEDIGSDIRSDKFTAPAGLPFPAPGPEETVGSWLHKGHNRRSGETTSSPAANARTYDMRNIMLQAENNNLGPWNGLENYYREFVTSGKHDVYVISGPVFEKGKRVKTVGKSSDAAMRIAQAPETFKIVMVMPKGQRPGTANPVRLISVITPNLQETCPIDANWADYRVTPADIEKKTGFRFFDNMPEKTAAKLRTHLDSAYVPLVLGEHAAELYERRGGKLPAAANQNAAQTSSAAAGGSR